jgi:hypothetical protein
MIARPTLHVLAEAAEIGLPETATVPARAFDPVLRPFIRKNVRKAIAAASTKTTSKHGDHLLRLAFLHALPAGALPPDLDPNDERAVDRAFVTLAAPYLPPRDEPNAAQKEGGAYRVTAADREDTAFVERKRPRRRWPITVPAVVVLLLATTAAVAMFLLPRLVPTPEARFRKTPLGQALGEPLTDVVVASNRGGDAAARAKLLTPEVKAQIGEDAYASLERAVGELRHVRTDGMTEIDGALAPLFLEVNELDAKLAARKVPAHLHVYGSASSGKWVVWLTSYVVERREELAFDGTPVRFVWGRRLDGLNLSDSSLYKAHAEDWGVVSMDRLEQAFVQTLLAPLAKGAPMAPDDSAPEKSARAEMSRTATRVIADEILTVTKVSAVDAAALHNAIAQRNEIAGSLSKMGYRFPVSSGIELSASTVRRVARSMEEYPHDRALLQDFLRKNDRAVSYRREVAPVVAILTQLEEEALGGVIVEQKRLKDVTELLKLDEDVANDPRARAVVAASLGMLARTQECPRLALWRVVRPFFDRDSSDVEAATATAFVLLRRLGLAPNDEYDTFMRGLRAALELPPAQVRAAAAATYRDIFGRDPPPFSRKVLP